MTPSFPRTGPGAFLATYLAATSSDPDGGAAPAAVDPVPEMVPERAADRRRRMGRVTVAAIYLGVVLLATLSGYEFGRAQWSPPANVTTVAGSPAAPMSATKVFAAVHNSIVLVSVKGGSSGTGFFYGPNRVVTNAHVVTASADAVTKAVKNQRQTVTLRLEDGRVVPGTVMALDTRLDVAVIAVKPRLGVAPLAFVKHSVDAEPGTAVMVAGHPFGGPLTISTGTLSGVVVNSQFAESEVQSVLMQTDAAVNPGNSGGPLLDPTGAVLGMVTLRPDEVNERPTAGISLALTADQVRHAVESLERDGKLSPPVMGVQVKTADQAKGQVRGARIVAVTTGSAAAGAGLRKGDVIVAFGGRPVLGSSDLIKAMVGRDAGDRVSLTYHRSGERRQVSLVLGER